MLKMSEIIFIISGS